MTDLLWIVVIVCAAVPIFSSERRVFWSCVGVASGAAFFAFYPNWKDGMRGVGMILAAVMMYAYFYTPYIKIRGKIYALSVQDKNAEHEDGSLASGATYDPAPDAYSGLVTAKKLWWILLPLLAISAINLYAFITDGMEIWVAAIGAVMIVLLAVGAGLGDASWGYHMARGNYVQFALAAVITAGTFTVIYLIVYFIAKRRPLRRRTSMEYRAHPRHQKRHPS